MAKIFISYRREDSEAHAGRIFDRLTARFGREAVFMDVDTIPFGVDFVAHLDAAVSQCDVVLAVIGERWLDARHEEGPRKGQRRLDDPTDFVRIEIGSALARDIPVVPVLVGRASMPPAADLPDALKGLARRNAAEVRPGRDFHDHMSRLIHGLEELTDLPAAEQAPDVGKARDELEKLLGQAEKVVDNAGNLPLLGCFVTGPLVFGLTWWCLQGLGWHALAWAAAVTVGVGIPGMLAYVFWWEARGKRMVDAEYRERIEAAAAQAGLTYDELTTTINQKYDNLKDVW